MDLLCAGCQTPTGHVDTIRYPIAPTVSYCPACRSHALVAAILARA